MLIINANIRKNKGTSACRFLRKNNKLPAILYGDKKEVIVIELNHNEILNQEKKPEFYELLILVIDEKKIKVKVQALQRHPFKPKLMHIDFFRV
ncbi:50S ribosomal protein L25 [Arsenophonus symbiont of Ornithomya chloropus]|uniref:50S ribosomal protein L25 n=1 Tax=Arsenophonus symbiont of Ornithomya chloropus TaxID=634121 RepID=UPI0032B11649